MRETSAAKTALADYKAMGPGRSLEKLQRIYQNTTEPSPPTRKLETPKLWSREHGWVAQAEAQDRAEDEKVLTAKAADRMKARERSLTIVQGAKARYARQVIDGELDYKTARDLEIIVKLEMALLGEPLADKLEVEHSGSVGTDDDRSPEERAAYHRRQAAKYGGAAADGPGVAADGADG